MRDLVRDLLPGLIGATIGGIVGYYAYGWAFDQGLKAGVVPGAMVGLGGGLLSPRKSRVRAIVCGIGGLALGLFVEWRWFSNDGPGPFLDSLPRRPPLVLLMIALGAFLAYRWGGDSFKRAAMNRATGSSQD